MYIYIYIHIYIYIYTYIHTYNVLVPRRQAPSASSWLRTGGYCSLSPSLMLSVFSLSVSSRLKTNVCVCVSLSLSLFRLPSAPTSASGLQAFAPNLREIEMRVSLTP